MKNRTKKLHILSTIIFVSIFAGLGTWLLLSGHAQTPTIHYVATNGSDSNSCSNASNDACLTFDRAYHVANPGDAVEVQAGVYDTPFINAAGVMIHGELITWDATKAGASGNVSFQPATGATVRVAGNIRVFGSHVIFNDMSVDHDVEAYNFDPNGIPAGHDVGFITFQNITARNFQISATHDITILGGSYGPSSSCQSAQPNLPQYGGQNNAVRPQQGVPDPFNIMIDGVTVHNVMSYDLVGCHTEGIAIFSGSNVTIRNSKFYGNDVYDMLLQSNSGSGPLGAMTIENNWFAATSNSAGTGSGYYSVDIETGDNLTYRHNSANQGVVFERLTSFSNTNIIGNLGGGILYAGATGNSSLCGMPGVTALYNIIQRGSGVSCTTQHNIDLGTTSPPFVRATNDASMDYHLTAGSSAQDFVPLGASSAIGYDGDPIGIDFDRHCRPSGAANDAGASEYGSTTACGVTTNGPSGSPSSAPIGSSGSSSQSPTPGVSRSSSLTTSPKLANNMSTGPTPIGNAPATNTAQSLSSRSSLYVTITIVNKSGKALPGAFVTVAGHTQVSNSRGQVTFKNLAAGKQRVSVKVNGQTIINTVQIPNDEASREGDHGVQFTLTAAQQGNRTETILIGIITVIFTLVVSVLLKRRIRFNQNRKFTTNTPLQQPAYESHVIDVPSSAISSYPKSPSIEPGTIVRPE